MQKYDVFVRPLISFSINAENEDEAEDKAIEVLTGDLMRSGAMKGKVLVIGNKLKDGVTVIEKKK